MIGYRSNLLGIAAPPVAPARPLVVRRMSAAGVARVRRNWTGEELDRVVALVGRKLSRSEIGEALDRTPGSVDQAIERLRREGRLPPGRKRFGR